jgi:putative membrane protein
MKRAMAVMTLSLACLATSPVLSALDRETAKERLFLLTMAQSQQGEMALAKMATQQAGSDRVKEFGHRIIDDFSKVNQHVAELAQTEGVELFKRMRLTAEHQDKVERLSRLSGHAFDRAYLDYLIKDHGEDLKAFERTVKQLKDASVKQWAEETMSVLEAQLAKAHEITAALSAESQ